MPEPRVYDPEAEELFRIREDVADPTGSGQRGVSFEYQLGATAIAHPSIRWRDRLTTADVYEQGDHLMVHLFCPQCGQNLAIHSNKKRVRLNRAENRIDIGERRNPDAALHCSWDECDWRAVVEDNIAKDV